MRHNGYFTSNFLRHIIGIALRNGLTTIFDASKVNSRLNVAHHNQIYALAARGLSVTQNALLAMAELAL